MRERSSDPVSPYPLLDTMPGVYRDDATTQILCEVFDDLLAPVFAILDGFTAYLDPGTTPEDMLDWLAGWVGVTFDGHLDIHRRRELLLSATALLPWRGTVRSIRAAVNAVTDQEVEIVDPGAAGPARPGAEHVLLVRVITDAPDDVDLRRLDAIVGSVKPAHLPHRVEAVAREAHSPAVSSA
ncbi:phage tail protein [Mycobacterium sp. PS03-16]|uniref:phage tail protein n=1 Tax=Mycobacterium sp. PS03-16 TaxID=2559611 RepID=UPI0010738B17|nr:phage tail protein [Mycobacterium sp. PS03-16]TFV61589.1 phage tail protein [Mycobacterium sp. PS03-16]